MQLAKLEYRMNRKSLIICLSVLAALVVFCVSAITVLYSGDKGGDTTMSQEELFAEASSRCPVLCAVPSDAAMILHGESLRQVIQATCDTTTLVGPLFRGTGRSSFARFLKDVNANLPGALKNAEATVSMHYSGDLVPLLVIDSGKMPSDSTSGAWTLVRFADSTGVAHAVIDKSPDHAAALKRKTLLVFSPSLPLVKSCLRHVDSGESVLEKTECAAIAAQFSGAVSVMVNGDYCGKLASSFLSRNFRKYSSFLKNFAGWTSFAVEEAGEKSLVMTGRVASYPSPAYFSNMYRSMQPSASRMAEILPAATVAAYGIQIADAETSCDLYSKYIDAAGGGDKNRIRKDTLGRRVKITPDVWAKAIDIKEVVRAAIQTETGVSPVLFIRPGKQDISVLFRGMSYKSLKDYDGGVKSNPYRGFAGALFGKLFDLPDSTFAYSEGWIIAGDRNTVSLLSSDVKRRRLKDFLSDSGLSSRMPTEGTVFSAYCRVSPEVISDVFSKDMGKDAKEILNGVSACPVFFSIAPGAVPKLKLDVNRIAFAGSEDTMPALLRDTVVNVPKGPFKVKNCGTGKTNLFAQQSNNYLVLKEENGKGIWGVPFGAPICGAVENIDYFGNGKLQFLFASGSKLYLIDRLGRFVKPFPVELGKEILLGPAAYDFTGAHGYTVQVLHKDNTIGMYDLHGKKPSSWKGIKTEETIKSLPELLKVKGKRFWIVRTSVRTLVFGFDGGEPLYSGNGNKMLLPDSKINVNDKGTVSALCYDGKERSLKL